MVYRPEYLAALRHEQDIHRPLLSGFLGTQREQRALIEDVVSGYSDFYRQLLCKGDIEGAINTGALQQLRKEGYFSTASEHVTGNKLHDQFRSWRMELISESVLGVAIPAGDSTAVEASYRIDLVMKLTRDATNRNIVFIDTEFFSSNTVFEGKQNQFDDLEKFHIIWRIDVDQQDEPRSLAYMGFGSNEPNRLEHARNQATGLGGKSRFFIYDPVDNRYLHYESSQERMIGEFDWQWKHYPVVERSGSWGITFVRMADGTRIILSDPFVVKAASGLTPQSVFSRLSLALGSRASFDSASSETQRSFLSNFQLCTISLTEHTGSRPPIVPTIADVNQMAGYLYPIYYSAILAPSVRTADAEQCLSVLKHRSPQRYSQYMRILDRPCREVYQNKYQSHLPVSMADVLFSPPTNLPPELESVMAEWRIHLCNELRLDLYHYGQNPYERVHVLRLGLTLATSEQFGGLYWKYLDQAEACVRGQECHGSFDVHLSVGSDETAE